MRQKIIYPLSGRGKQIIIRDYENGKFVTWGDTSFNVPDSLITDILENYFKNPNMWYPLGASMTEPPSNGLGRYIQTRYNSLTPRHASAIAAIMVEEKLLKYRGAKPIELKKMAR